MIVRRKEHVWLLLPTVVTLILITIFPLLYSLNVSMRDYSLARGKTVHEFNNFQNFVHVLKDGEFWNSLWVTGKLSFWCLIIELPLGLGLAMLFSRPGYKLEPLSLLMILPMAISPVVIGLVFRWFYSAEVGIFGYLIQSIGITPPSWSSSKTAALWSIIIADCKMPLSFRSFPRSAWECFYGRSASSAAEWRVVRSHAERGNENLTALPSRGNIYLAHRRYSPLEGGRGV